MTEGRCGVLPSSDPRVFGPPVWKTLHIIAQNYPEQADEKVQRNMRRLLLSVSRLLPCHHCGKHFRHFLRSSDLPAAVSGKAELVSLLVEAHNHVNRHTRPEQLPYSVHCAQQLYTQMAPPTVPLAKLWTGSDPKEEERACSTCSKQGAEARKGP